MDRNFSLSGNVSMEHGGDSPQPGELASCAPDRRRQRASEGKDDAVWRRRNSLPAMRPAHRVLVLPTPQHVHDDSPPSPASPASTGVEGALGKINLSRQRRGSASTVGSSGGVRSRISKQRRPSAPSLLCARVTPHTVAHAQQLLAENQELQQVCRRAMCQLEEAYKRLVRLQSLPATLQTQLERLKLRTESLESELLSLKVDYEVLRASSFPK